MRWRERLKSMNRCPLSSTVHHVIYKNEFCEVRPLQLYTTVYSTENDSTTLHALFCLQ